MPADGATNSANETFIALDEMYFFLRCAIEGLHSVVADFEQVLAIRTF